MNRLLLLLLLTLLLLAILHEVTTATDLLDDNEKEEDSTTENINVNMKNTHHHNLLVDGHNQHEQQEKFFQKAPNKHRTSKQENELYAREENEEKQQGSGWRGLGVATSKKKTPKNRSKSKNRSNNSSSKKKPKHQHQRNSKEDKKKAYAASVLADYAASHHRRHVSKADSSSTSSSNDYYDVDERDTINKKEDTITTTSTSRTTKATNDQGIKSKELLEVVELTTRNFRRTINDGSIWFIEFYAPNCIHCQEFAYTYSEIAKHYHSTNYGRTKKKKIKIGKINGTIEKALVNRFGIYAYPTFFLIDGYSIYEYNTSHEHIRTKPAIMKFVEGGYKKCDPMPFYASPMGPLGQIQALLISIGFILHDIFTYSQTHLGLAPMITGMLFFGSIFLGCFFLIVILALAIPPKHKIE